MRRCGQTQYPSRPWFDSRHSHFYTLHFLHFRFCILVCLYPRKLARITGTYHIARCPGSERGFRAGTTILSSPQLIKEGRITSGKSTRLGLVEFNLECRNTQLVGVQEAVMRSML